MPKYLLNSFLAGFFTVTFSASPFAVAAGNEKQPMNISVLKATFKDMKITTASSYGDMLASLEKKQPKHAMLFRQLAKLHQDDKFPKIQAQEFKYKGKDAIKLITQMGGQQVVVEYLFNGNEMMKINGTVFTKRDTDSARRFNKKLKSIPAFAKAQADYRKKIFATSTRPTFEQWKKLSRAQRAEYYMLYRQLLETASLVNTMHKYKVGSIEHKSFEKWAQEIIAGSEAHAESASIGNREPASTAAGRTAETAETTTDQKIKDLKKTIGYNVDKDGNAQEHFSEDSCIVAGYARKWVRKTCPWNGNTEKGGKEFYEKYPINNECGGFGSGMIACNTIVYGFSSNGKPHCIDTRVKSPPSSNFNHATHADGPCEAASPLNTPAEKMEFLKNILNRGDLKEASKKLKLNAQGDLVTDDKDLFEKIFYELTGPLGDYIHSAETICEETSQNSGSYKYKDSKKPPKEQKGPKLDVAYQDQACDALMKRAAAVIGLLKLQPQPPAPSLAAVCDTSPKEQVDVADGACVCKDKGATNDKKRSICLPAAAATQAPIVTSPSTPVIAPEPSLVDQAADCGSFFSRMNPAASECSSTGGDWLITGGLFLLGACIFEWFGICKDNKDKFEVPKVTDPIPACDPATGKCPGDKDDDVPGDKDPVNPNPPAASEQTTNNQGNPANSVNSSVVPPRVR